MKLSRRLRLSLSVKSLCILFSATGIGLSFLGTDTFMSGWRLLLFFTIQSNIWVIVIMAIFLFLTIREAKKGPFEISHGLRMTKFIFTVAIALTFIVFAILLSPLMSIAYLTSPSNICIHFLAPILAIIDFLVFDQPLKTKKGLFLLGMITPVYYFAFSMICSFLGVVFYRSGATVPYFFLNYELYGWFRISSDGLGVVYWFIILGSLVCLISWGLLKIQNAIHHPKENKK